MMIGREGDSSENVIGWSQSDSDSEAKSGGGTRSHISTRDSGPVECTVNLFLGLAVTFKKEKFL